MNINLRYLTVSRTIETQKYIFELFKKEISSQQPNLAEEELIRETIKLVPHPEIHLKNTMFYPIIVVELLI